MLHELDTPSSFSPQSKFEVRDCATLGTLFADVYADGVIFARELPRDLAEQFVRDTWMFGGTPFVDTPKLRTWAIEQVESYLRPVIERAQDISSS